MWGIRPTTKLFLTLPPNMWGHGQISTDINQIPVENRREQSPKTHLMVDLVRYIFFRNLQSEEDGF